MELTKYTFRTPLFGSIDCEEVLSDTDGSIELSPKQMCSMYDKGPELLLFLSEHAEDLAPCVPEEVANVVLRAEFGDCAMISGRMWLRTYVWVDGDLTESRVQTIQDWIIGQMSDGWGEGLEQREWKMESVRTPVLYFNEGTLEFEEDHEYRRVAYYVHPWKSEEFEIFLEDVENVEEDATFEVVATLALPLHNRQVIKLKNDFSLKLFLKDLAQREFVESIQECCPLPNCSIYIVRDLDGNSGVEILPKWALEQGSFCSLYDMTDDVDIRGTQMPVSKAVLELLK